MHQSIVWLVYGICSSEIVTNRHLPGNLPGVATPRLKSMEIRLVVVNSSQSIVRDALTSSILDHATSWLLWLWRVDWVNLVICDELTSSIVTMWPEQSTSGQFFAQCYSPFLWCPLSAPLPPTSRSTPAQAFCGKSTHSSTPAHAVFCPLCSISTLLSAYMRRSLVNNQ